MAPWGKIRHAPRPIRPKRRPRGSSGPMAAELTRGLPGRVDEAGQRPAQRAGDRTDPGHSGMVGGAGPTLRRAKARAGVWPPGKLVVCSRSHRTAAPPPLTDRHPRTAVSTAGSSSNSALSVPSERSSLSRRRKSRRPHACPPSPGDPARRSHRLSSTRSWPAGSSFRRRPGSSPRMPSAARSTGSAPTSSPTTRSRASPARSAQSTGTTSHCS